MGRETPGAVSFEIHPRTTALVGLVADACASQPIGSFNAEEPHNAAVQRMGYLFASVTDTESVIARLRAFATSVA